MLQTRKDFKIHASANESEIRKVRDLLNAAGISLLVLTEAPGSSRKFVWIARDDVERAKEALKALEMS